MNSRGSYTLPVSFKASCMADPAHQDHQDSLNGKLGRVFAGRWFGWEPGSQNVEPCLVGAPFCRQHSKAKSMMKRKTEESFTSSFFIWRISVTDLSTGQ